MVEKLTSQEWFQGLLDFVFPPLCLGCGDYHDDNNQICERCFKKFDVFEYPLCLKCRVFIEEGIDCQICKKDSLVLFSYANYQPPLKDIIHQFKFKGITSPATTFAKLAFEKFQLKLESLNAGAIVPIPLHPSRERRRGYNQAELISNHLAELMSLPVGTELLFRTKKGREQARLPFEKRIENIKDAFSVDESNMRFEKVILVDDVVTSGATVLEATRVLEKAGVKVAAIVAISHGI